MTRSATAVAITSMGPSGCHMASRVLAMIPSNPSNSAARRRSSGSRDPLMLPPPAGLTFVRWKHP